MAKSRGRSRLGQKGKKGKKGKKQKKGAAVLKPKKVALENAVPAICSECFGDFQLSTAPQEDRITCPTCGHIGIVENGVFGEIGKKRKDHKLNFIVALAVNLIALLCILSWGLMNSAPFAEVLSNGAIKDGMSENVSMALIGAGVLFLLAGFFMIYRYERSRVEVYF